MRIPIILFLIFTASALSLTAATDQPNVILIISDDHAFDDYGFMGSSQVQTPALDELASESLTYTRGYVMPVCSPTLASLLTGKLPHEHGITGNDLSPQSPQKNGAKRDPIAERLFNNSLLLPKALTDAGYLTFQTGKLWNGSYEEMGFTHGMTKEGSRHGDTGLGIGRHGMQPIFNFIEKVEKAEKPFFIWYAPFLPHTPHNPPERLLKKYRGKGPTPAAEKYFAMVEWLDETIGELDDYLEKNNLEENTVILYLADNGWHAEGGYNGQRAKLSPYEDGIRTPIMVRWPGKVSPEMDTTTLAHVTDVTKTILELTEASDPGDLPGLNLLDREAMKERNTVFVEAYTHDMADLDAPQKSLLANVVIDGWWKLIIPTDVEPRMRFATKPERLELYDLKTDPYEKENVADQHPDVVARLMRLQEAQWNPDIADESAGPTRDNVLLITIDDLNDWIGSMTDGKGRGHPQAKTPHLDSLVENGVLFTNAHCQAPICIPSRTSFMSGLRPSTSGIYGNRSNTNAEGILKPGEDVPWLTKRFEQAGYDVFVTGKILHASKNEPLGGTQSFKTSQGPYPPHKIGIPKEVTHHAIWDLGAFPEEERYTDRRIAEWTIGNINKPVGEDDKPRFMALGFYNPHLPLFAPQRYFDAAPTQEEVILAPRKEGDLDDVPEIAKRINHRVSFTQCHEWALEDEKNMRALTQAYLASVTAMDDQLGKVIAALENSDMADNTWIVVFSDHGWHLGEKEAIAKQTFWNHSTRVPLIVVPPKRMKDMPRGVHSPRPVELLDVYPTLVETTGLKPIEADQDLEGISLLPWLKAPEASKERPALTTLYGHNHSLVGDRYRYTRYADGSEELYDHLNDPLEYENLIEQAREDAELQEIISILSAHIPENEVGKPDLMRLPRTKQ